MKEIYVVIGFFLAVGTNGYECNRCRYLPPKGTAGFARSRVRRVPLPPASTMPNTRVRTVPSDADADALLGGYVLSHPALSGTVLRHDAIKGRGGVLSC